MLQKMKEDNISQLGDYDAPSVNNTRMGLVISLCPNSNHLISLISPPPQTASNFRHLHSCGTIGPTDLIKMALSQIGYLVACLQHFPKCPAAGIRGAIVEMLYAGQNFKNSPA